MKKWKEDIFLQILLQIKFWMHDIGGQVYSRISYNFLGESYLILFNT
jgi:hypothetical protein